MQDAASYDPICSRNIRIEARNADIPGGAPVHCLLRIAAARGFDCATTSGSAGYDTQGNNQREGPCCHRCSRCLFRKITRRFEVCAGRDPVFAHQPRSQIPWSRPGPAILYSNNSLIIFQRGRGCADGRAGPPSRIPVRSRRMRQTAAARTMLSVTYDRNLAPRMTLLVDLCEQRVGVGAAGCAEAKFPDQAHNVRRRWQ